MFSGPSGPCSASKRVNGLSQAQPFQPCLILTVCEEGKKKTPIQLAHEVTAFRHRVYTSPGQENQLQTPPVWGKYILLRRPQYNNRHSSMLLNMFQESFPFTGMHRFTPADQNTASSASPSVSTTACFCQRLLSELPVLSWCQSTQCCPGVRSFKGMKASPSSVFSQNAPSPSTRRCIDLWLKSPRGIPSYTS